MNKDELQEILAGHVEWLNGDGESRANLSRAYLRGANLSGANLSGANLSRAYLRGADLSDANLSGANLRGANLSGANLSDANLSGANLSDADLSDADLRGAYLRGANLSGANLSGAKGLTFQIPQEGELITWKAVQGGIAKLRVPPDARRTGCLTNRKCRAEWVETLAIYTDGREIDSAPGRHASDIIYKVGEVTRPDSYDDDIRVDCTHGIHFFLSKEEAEAW